MLVYYTIVFPDPLSVRAKGNAPVIRIVARDGTLLARRGAARDYVPIDLVPKHVIDAVVATEDRRFFSHFGFDPAGLIRAAFANLRAGRFVQGGSTLTQQLAKNLFLTPERTMSRKLDELALAVWLEVRLSKQEILELYLNRVYFGGGAYGIEAASQRYFDKSVRALSVAQAALIAGLLKAPSKYAPTSRKAAAIRRARSVLAKMRRAGVITDAVYRRERFAPMRFADFKGVKSTNGFAYAIDLVLERLPPILGSEYTELIVETTIDAALQRHANRVVGGMLDGKGHAMSASQAALVSLDGSGGIRVLIGGRSYADSQFNRATKARRQPGSAFKPFVYLTALENGMQPDTITYDLPITIDGWSPRNDNNKNVGALMLRQALAASVNTVAVRLASDLGLKSVIETARRLGITSELREDPSLALGTSELTLLELVGAYGALSNGGHSVDPYIIRRVRLNTGRVLYARGASRQKRVIADRDVGGLNDMLNAALVAGTGRRAALPRHPAAGKTGTTQDFRDAWFVGYTAHLTTGVWIGNDDGAPMKRVMGGNLPAGIWRAVMAEAHRELVPKALPGTSQPDPVAARSGLAPVARSGATERLPWNRRGPAASSSHVVRAPATSPTGVRGVRGMRDSAMAKLAPSQAPLPGRAVRRQRQTRPRAQVAAVPKSPAIGQRIVLEPPPAAVIVPGASPVAAPGAAAAAKPSRPQPPRYPSTRIEADVFARMLQGPSAADKTAVDVGRDNGFDPDAIRRQLEGMSNTPEQGAKPRGLMALGAGR